jgi:peptide/nickel transport system permease protein
MKDNDKMTDGGSAERLIFSPDPEEGDVSESVSRRDRFARVVENYVLTPLRIGWSDWRTRIGGTGLLVFILMGTIGVLVIPEAALNEGPRYLSPFKDWSMPFGTDNVGRGIAKRIVHATPAMLKMAAAGVIFSSGVALVVGFLSGYKGGLLDTALMTVTDVVITLPGLPLIIVIAAVYPPSDPFVVGAILAIDEWPGLARAIRSQVLTLREESYVEAARTMDMPTRSIIARDLVPQLAPYILVRSANAARGVITASVALYFLGILPFTTSNWGVMMNFAHTKGQALANFGYSGHWMLFPGLALAGLTFSLVLFAQGLDRVFNPRIRARHSKTTPEEEGIEQ